MTRTNFLRALYAAALLVLLTGPLPAQQQHACARDAIKRADGLLKLHFLDGAADPSFKATIGGDVKSLPPVKALKGKGAFDVLEVRGYIYKAEYRMRFLYAQIKNSCVLMGQEILEVSDPY